VSNENPLAPSLYELVEKHADVGKNKAADIKAEELGRVASAELETNLGLVCMSETWVFDLTCDLILHVVSIYIHHKRQSVSLPRVCAASNNLANALM